MTFKCSSSELVFFFPSSSAAVEMNSHIFKRIYDWLVHNRVDSSRTTTGRCWLEQWSVDRSRPWLGHVRRTRARTRVQAMKCDIQLLPNFFFFAQQKYNSHLWLVSNLNWNEFLSCLWAHTTRLGKATDWMKRSRAEKAAVASRATKGVQEEEEERDKNKNIPTTTTTAPHQHPP